MMSEYHKIQTVYHRDPENNHKTLLEGRFSIPEFEYLANNKWSFTEKVDGTNIRVYFNQGAYGEIAFRGRTDRADIPPFLLDALADLFSVDKMYEAFGEKEVILYGEGYGPKIQKSGGLYRDTPSFVLFDVKLGEWWLQRADVEDVAEKLDLDVVPIIGHGTLYDMVEMARSGIISKWGEFQAEGVVARPVTELMTRSGHRVITKVKCKDFVAGKN